MLSSTQTVDRTISLPDATGTLLYGGGPLGTPSSGTVTNLTGTASININGTVGATTASTGAFTTLSASGLTKIGTQTATLPADTTLWIEGGKTQRFGSSNYDADFGSYFKPSLSGSTTGQLTIGTRTSAVDTDILLISSTGLAVTGALSATGRCLIGTTTGVGNDFTSIRFNSSGSYPQGLNMVDAYASASGSVFQVFRKSDDTYLGNIRRSGTDNAIYVGGNSYLALGSGDTERMRIDSSGNVGIGSTTPYNALTIQGSSSRMDLNDGGGASRKALLLEPLGYGGNAYARIESYNYGTSTGGNLVINGTGGNVGIGTTSPAFPLDVNLGLVVRGSAARSGSGMFLANDSTYGLSINAVNHLVAGLPLAIMGYPIKFLSSETGGELARIDTSGNVGIGTTSPTRQLQVSNTSNAVISAINGSIEGVLNATTAGVNFGSASNHFVTLSTNGVERARIDTSGNLLVGTTSTIDIGKISLLFDASSQNGISVKSSSATYSNNLMSFVNAGGSQVGYIYTNGTITTYSGTSDYRLKDITGPLTDSGVFIDALKPKVGTWKSDGSKFVGFLAHEFAEVSPSSVNGEKDAVDAEGNPKYQGMQAGTAEVIANLVAELQSLRQRVAALESN
jgi:hypothetical protein